MGSTVIITPDVPAQVSITPDPPKPEEGFFAKASRIVNTPIGDLLSGQSGATRRVILQAVGQQMGIDLSPENLKTQMERVDPDHPYVQGLRTFLAGAAGDTADTAAGFTSPLGLGAAGLGAAGKVPGAVGRIAKAGMGLAGAGLAAKGEYDSAGSGASAGDTLQAIFYGTGLSDTPPDATPEQIQKRLQGQAMIAGGAAGVKEGAPALKTAVADNIGKVASGAARLAEKGPADLLAGTLSEKMAEKPPGSPFTRQEILDAAREHGINLDLADATDSGVAHAVKKSASVSIAGKGTMEANATKNLNALESWADQEEGRYSPQQAPRESVGPLLQQALQKHLQALKNYASQQFTELDSSVGNANVDATNTVEAEARKILAENTDYYAKHPELKPAKAWGVLEDLAERPEATRAQAPSGLLDESGKPYPGKPATLASENIMSWSELHQLRSDLMDFYRNNPDVVKGRSEAWIQRMVGKIDEAMTNASSGLSGADLARFREANSTWENIKSTYDNPQSRYYHAIRSNSPSQVPQMLSSGSTELARSVMATLDSLHDGGTARGQFQRQFVENLLNNKSGQLDLKNLNSRLSRMPEDVLQAMLDPEGARRIRMLGRVAAKVTGDVNPSGTAKVVAPFSEGALLVTHPVAGVAELGANYAGAKTITSPRVVDLLTRPRR